MYPKEIKERTFQFALQVLLFCKKMRNEDKIVLNQLSRSATSVGANVREARNAASKKDFVHKLTIAQKECDESLYWLELSELYFELNINEIIELKKEAKEILLVLSSIILNTKKSMNC